VRYCFISYVLPAMAAIFDLPLTPISESVHTSSTVLLKPEIVGVAFGFSLLSSIEAKILRSFICTSGNGDFRTPVVEVFSLVLSCWRT